MDDDLATWLNKELSKRSWSGRELARRAGVSHNTIANALKGEGHPTPELCQAIARVFQIPVEEVFRRAGLLPISKSADGEDELLLYFRELPEEDRRRAIRIIRGLWEDHKAADA